MHHFLYVERFLFPEKNYLTTEVSQLQTNMYALPSLHFKAHSHQMTKCSLKCQHAHSELSIQTCAVDLAAHSWFQTQTNCGDEQTLLRKQKTQVNYCQTHFCSTEITKPQKSSRIHFIQRWLMCTRALSHFNKAYFTLCSNIVIIRAQHFCS